MQRKVKTLETVQVKEALRAHGRKLGGAEERALRMLHGAAVQDQAAALPRKTADPALRARLAEMELELLRKWRTHLEETSKRDRIVRALKKKT